MVLEEQIIPATNLPVTGYAAGDCPTDYEPFLRGWKTPGWHSHAAKHYQARPVSKRRLSTAGVSSPFFANLR